MGAALNNGILKRMRSLFLADDPIPDTASLSVTIGATVAPYLLVALIIFLQHPVPLLRAEFWAEDLTEIFKAAYELGPRSIITPVWGYHMLIPRIIGYLATFFPVIAAPFIYAWSCYALAIVTMGYFSRKGFSFIIPSRVARIAVCAVLAVAPGTAEVYLNFANLTTLLSMLAVLMLIERPFTLGPVRLSAFILIAFSAGQLFLFLPMMLFLLLTTRDQKYLIPVLIVLCVMVINFLGVTDPTAKTVTEGRLNMKNIRFSFEVFTDNFFYRLLYLPFLGRNITEWFITRPAYIFWPITLLIAGACAQVGIKAKAYLSREFWLWIIIYSCAIGAFAVIAIVRDFPVTRLHRYSYWGQRYSFLPAVITIVGWLGVFWHMEKKRISRIVIGVCVLLLLLLGNSFSWCVAYRRPDLQWPIQTAPLQAAIELKRAGVLSAPVTVTIRAHPDGWKDGVTIFP